MTAAESIEAPGGGSGWSARFPLRWWDLAVGLLMLVLCAQGAVFAVEGDPEWTTGAPLPARLATVGAPLAAFALLYIGLGRRVLRDEADGTGGGAATSGFLVGLAAVLFAAVFVEPMYALLQAVAYPIVWTTAPRYRVAVAWSAVIALSVGTAMFGGLIVVDPVSAVISAGFTVLLSFTFAVAMGTWISRIFDRGERHREIAEQLRRSQAEVAQLSKSAGASAERERMSRELHDTLTQTLAGLVMLSEQAERALDTGDTERARDRLARVGSAAREAVSEARALVATTQPLGEGGLVASIERVAARLRADTGLEVECELQRIPLEREREVVLLRAVQEGLANARKHARASTVRVTLAGMPSGGAMLRVDDDGIGPPGGRAVSPDASAPSSAGTDAGAVVGAVGAAGVGTAVGSAGAVEPAGDRPAGFGLSGLADRVRSVGGSVAFLPLATGGSRLEVQLDACAADAARTGEEAGE